MTSCQPVRHGLAATADPGIWMSDKWGKNANSGAAGGARTQIAKEDRQPARTGCVTLPHTWAVAGASRLWFLKA